MHLILLSSLPVPLQNTICGYVTDFYIRPMNKHIKQQPNSMMTFEGQQFQGPTAIVEKLSAIGSVKHTVKSRDLQPTFSENALVIFVTGTVQISGDNPIHFSELFILVSTAPQQYYVHNCIFRLNYGL
jgi:hypothetical protein